MPSSERVLGDARLPHTAPARPTPSHHAYLSLLVDQGMKILQASHQGRAVSRSQGVHGQSHLILMHWILPEHPLVAAEMNPVHPAGPRKLTAWSQVACPSSLQGWLGMSRRRTRVSSLCRSFRSRAGPWAAAPAWAAPAPIETENQNLGETVRIQQGIPLK